MNKTRMTQLARCPHCDSVFEVSDKELELAFGAVRCGECMKIFNARFHRLEASEDQLIQEASPTDDSKPDPIPTLRDQYQADKSDPVPVPEEETGWSWPEEALSEEDFEEAFTAEDEEIEREFQAFEAELETAFLDSDTEETLTQQADPFQADAEPTTSAEASDPLTDDPEPLDLYSEDLNLENELAEEAREREEQPSTAAKRPWYRQPLLASLLLAGILVATGLGSWQFFSAQASSDYQISQVQLAPAQDPQKMQVSFQLSNPTTEPLPWPNLEVELLNLSLQVIASQTLQAEDLPSAEPQLPPGSQKEFSVEVDRPSTYVQNARINPLP
ncbi:DUF3426 domain-containing protein [Marinospirillum perlucidum]|uniref:DUF3426 domain-containing protein n=1 Tax=Marinospirillum perlucidum TaxID=1982602 RepID=UPI000DF3433A|nr:DUF3426 domain-containing protein [Marinospirillum perlucidum]